MRAEFRFDTRLGIHLPELEWEWEEYGDSDRAEILEQWERIRGRIPNRIFEIEFDIIRKQAELNVEEDFPRSCRLNSEIAELASMINDLHIWYRMDQEFSDRVAHL
jgi:hypothetical protein